MVSTRRQHTSEAWITAMQSAAKLPAEVVACIVDCCCAAASLDSIDPQTWASASCSSTFTGLDRLRRVSKAFNERISTHPAFLQLLQCERLRAFERLTWTDRESLSQKKLPKSFTLQFPASSTDKCTSTATFHIHKAPKHPRWLVVEARDADSTPAQVLELLRLMCHLQGRVCAMMYVIRISSSSLDDWQQQIVSGAKALDVNSTAADGWVRFYPNSKRFVHMVRLRTNNT